MSTTLCERLRTRIYHRPTSRTKKNDLIYHCNFSPYKLSFAKNNIMQLEFLVWFSFIIFNTVRYSLWKT